VILAFFLLSAFRFIKFEVVLLPMRMKFVFVAALVFSFHFVFSQQGNYFLNHYTPSDERIDYVTYGIAQDQKGIIYFANKSGVLQFDGRNWNLISTPGPVYSITTKGEDVFAAGFNGFGKLLLGKNNTWSYESLSHDLPNATQLFASRASSDDIFFLNHEAVFIYSLAKGKTQILKAEAAYGSFEGIFEILGNIYINTELQGIIKIDQGKLVKSDLVLPGGEAIVFCSSLEGKERVLLGGVNGNLFVYDKQRLKEIETKDKAFLETNIIVEGTWVSEQLIAVGTLRGGVIFINPETGTTEEITNFYTGLPDNEVYSILCDRNQGVWVANDYGFTRIAPYLPFRSFNHYSGLSGNLLCVTVHNEQIYVGTTLGLFTLKREEIFEAPAVITGEKKINRLVQTPPAEVKSKKGLFSFLRKEKKKNAEGQTSSMVASKSNPKLFVQPKPVRPVLKTIQYSYKKVAGIEGKVSQLMTANGKLLAAGTIGIVEISGLQSKPITKHPVRSMFLSPSLNQLIASTDNEEIKTFAIKSKDWAETHLLDTLQGYVSYIFEDKLQNIWLCSRTNVFKVETIDHEITVVESIPLANPSIDETTGLAYGSEVYVTASGTFNRFNVGKNIFEKYDSLPGTKKYFASAGYFWFYDGHRWRTVDSRMQAALKLEWLSLFQNIRFLSPADKAEGLWVITASNELYKFSSNKVATEQVSYPLFLKEVRGQQNKLAPARTVKVSQLESTVTFEFIQPDFLGMKAIEYRYLIKGLNKDWSAWSTDNNIVNFSYLPVGNYRIDVQTRDLMGKISNVEQIELEVEPPYWKQSWFYASEFIFFSLLVFLSRRMGKSNSKYQVLSRLLSLLTVIMLIQFVQTVVESQISLKSTPVIEFFIQVSIALLVLPLEEFLRKIIAGSSASEQVSAPKEEVAEG
jgi:hypothetical protein